MLVGVGPVDPLAYVAALALDYGHHPAVAVEAVFRLGVAYAGHGVVNGLLNVYVSIVGMHFASYYHEACGAESLHSHLGLGVLAEEFIED